MSFGFGPEFAPSEEICSQAYDEVMSGVIIDESIRAGYKPDFIEACRSGDPRKEDKVAFKWLLKEDWSWPIFEEWWDHFTKNGQYPGGWLLEKGLFSEYGSQKHKEALCRLLRRHICAVISRLRELENKDRLPESIFKRNHYRALSTHCPVEDEFADQFNKGELKQWPPYFPGNRTGVVLYRKDLE